MEPLPDPPALDPALPAPPRRSVGSLALGALIGAALVLAAVGSWWWAVPRISEETVQTAVWTAIQRESADQFLVVGTLDMGVEAEATTTTTLLPGTLNIETGRKTARVRAPGRASYGFDIGTLRPSDIRYTPDGVVIVAIPPLRVFSSEVMLEDAELSVTASRWQRIASDPDQPAVRAALGRLRPAVQEQATAHLGDSEQPRRNAARAVERMIRTPLEAAGVENARFRFVVAPGDTLDGGGGDR